MKKILFLCFYFLTIACTKTVEPPEIVPASEIKLSWESKGGAERKEWTKTVVDLVQKDLDVFSNAKDVKNFCPNYAALDETHKVWVWSELVSSISWFESKTKINGVYDWNPNSTYQEPPPPKGPGTLSVGLLQMSVGDGYEGCFKKSDSSNLLKDPKNNLKCGLSAMVTLIRKRGQIIGLGTKPYSGLPEYWSVTRSTASGHHRDELFAMVKKVPGC